MELLIGLIGALVGIGLFLAGFFMGKAQGKPWAPVEVPMTDDEVAKAIEERERMIAEQQAFRKLMNYGVEQAYGMTDAK